MNSSPKGILKRKGKAEGGAKFIKSKTGKYDGQGLMLFEKQKKYMNRKKAPGKLERKKKMDRLRYLLK